MNKLVIAQIEKFSHDARGIARVNGKTTFIDGALPLETVAFEYTRKKKDYDDGRVISVIEASPDRTEPHCPHYDLCGGCSLQHVKPETQIHVKQQQLLDLLTRVHRVQPLVILPPLVGDYWHYRHKARLSVRFVEKKQSVMVGFREKKNPRYITPITECSVLSAKLKLILPALSALIESLDAKLQIPQIEIAVGDVELALIFRHMSDLSVADQAYLRDFAKTHAIRLFLQSGGLDTVKLFYPEDGIEFLTYSLPDQQVTFQFHPTDFTQVNAALNRKMVNQALKLLDLQSDDIVLDLFCGLGNFSLPLARFCGLVIGVEGSEQMVHRARMNAQLNQITNTQFECMNLDDDQALSAIQSYQVNKILIDPPRTGALAFVKKIHHLAPTHLVYVSCDPATLARDSAVLVHEQGYKLVSVGVMDMFPQTTHVESIALFQKNKGLNNG